MSDVSKLLKTKLRIPEINLRNFFKSIPILGQMLKDKEMQAIQRAVDALDQTTFDNLAEACAVRIGREEKANG